ncbi:hypothetical protein AT15_02015 [Kosmotoga arenicorallina S304]|uniref:Uncharacterized protein n=1 Tax=Kosmotoga arenicorallina S304 TaxID=1453497 RepID=A0A176JZF7_9BACT|nr:hypothetical protein [Kosmotoga arenicorallina]OAA29472.1 hypothetical protein AT15_02015 [Kosmotoga arenicorallina S304]
MKRWVVLFVFLLISLGIFGISYSIGVNISGFIEPFVMARFELGTVDLMVKGGFVFSNRGLEIVSPGIFVSTDLSFFRPHAGIEGFWNLKEMECLLLGKIGTDFRISLSFASLYLGADIGLAINLPGDFFVSIDEIVPIPTLTAYLEW